MSKPIAIGDVVEVFGLLVKVTGFLGSKLIVSQPGKNSEITVEYSDITKHYKQVKQAT